MLTVRELIILLFGLVAGIGLGVVYAYRVTIGIGRNSKGK